MFRALGRTPMGKERQKVQASPHYQNKQFQNEVPTSMMSEGFSMARVMIDFINKPKSTIPPKPLPAVKTNLASLSGETPVIVWFGHSSYLIHINNKNILVDPVFSGYVSPVKGFNKAFAGTQIYSVADMPDIDVLLITHDHYDHLDYETVLLLKPKVKHVITSLGVSSHLTYWGYDSAAITELDWHQSYQFEDLLFTALPARHFSGRTLGRNQTLWSAFTLQTSGCHLFLGGDSGYANHFKDIGNVYGPFDYALLECGQYNLAWHDIHMLPEETVQAAIDLRCKVFQPVHWAKFSISLHPWDEPIKRVVKAADEKQVSLTTPMIGEPVILNKTLPVKHWWESV